MRVSKTPKIRSRIRHRFFFHSTRPQAEDVADGIGEVGAVQRV